MSKILDYIKNIPILSGDSSFAQLIRTYFVGAFNLIIGLILVVLGINVVKMSGKGLGYIGGIIDKLEFILGFIIVLFDQEFIS